MLIELFIPIADNDGQVFDPAHHALFEQRLLDLFGGYTRRGTVQGAWKDGKQVYHDDLRVYVVRLTSIRLGDRVGEAVDFAKAHYGQLALFVSYLGLSEVL